MGNLLDNALYWARYRKERDERSAQAAVLVTSDWDKTSSSGMIAVVDNGPGFSIPLNRATEAFFTTRPGGMGLGLYFANLVMEQVGGELTIESASDLRDEIDIPRAFDGAAVVMRFGESTIMFGPIRAVAIDDEPGDLLAITTGLSASGIPCLGYWYDRDAHALRPEPKPETLPYVRVVFMDLNLEELGGIPETAALCATAMDVLKQIIPADGGPYLLVFWTQVGTKVEDVRKMLYQRLEGIPFPISVVELAKAPFLVKPAEGQDFKSALREFYTELHKNIPELEKAVKEVVARDPASVRSRRGRCALRMRLHEQ